MPRLPNALVKLGRELDRLSDRIESATLQFVRRSKDKKEQEEAIYCLNRFVRRVDPGIEDLITCLNLLGFDTSFSCESHWPGGWGINPYIMFGSMWHKPKEKRKLRGAMKKQREKIDLLLKAFYLASHVPSEHRLVTKSRSLKGRVVRTAFLLENKHSNTNLEQPPEELALLAYHRRKEFINFGKFLKAIWENS